MISLYTGLGGTRSNLDLTLLGEKSFDAPRVQPLLSEHLDNAIETFDEAFREDPMQLYIRAGMKSSPFHEAMRKRLLKLRFKRELKYKVAYTINAGDAIVFSTPPESDVTKPSPIDRTLGSLLNAIDTMFHSLHREQAKRLKELQRKAEELIETQLGTRVGRMFYVNLLATKPELQGQGYGSALLSTILFSADIRELSVYLLSSSTANVSYYESFGFVRTAHLLLGDDNPKWERPPVVVPLMVRVIKRND